MIDHPFLRLDSPNRVHMLTDAAHSLILTQGHAFLSQRALADAMDMTSAGLIHLFGGKSRMVETIAAQYGARWIGWARPRIGWDGAVGALPRDDREREGTAVWLAIQSLGRANPAIASEVAPILREERECIARVLVVGPHPEVLDARHAGGTRPSDPAASPAQLALLLATIEGLRHALTAPGEPLDLEQAHDLLNVAVEDLRARQREPPT